MRATSFFRVLVVAALALPGGGCARVLGGYDVAPSGLDRNEEQLRTLLGSGQAASAIERFGSGHPEDAVLRALYEGVLAYYAGDYARSAQVLDDASYAADDRVTKSVSRSALSLVSNDRVLPYEPGRTERLLIPYYAALARLRLNDISGAAVEARRMSALLQQYRDDDVHLDPALVATLRYLAGAIFEAEGNRTDADVAYRNALTADSTLPLPAAHDAYGSVVVVLEQGFVAHRVEQALAVMLRPEEVHAIADGAGDDRAKALGLVAGRVLERAVWTAEQRDRFDREPYHRGTLFVPAPEHTDLPRKRKTVCRDVEQAEKADSSTSSMRTVSNERSRTERVCEEKDDDELPYLLKVAWPVYRNASRAQQARLIASDTVTFFGTADVSRGVVADFEAERALVVARTIARGTAKLALTKGAENRLEEKNEAAGMLVGLLGNIGNVLLERADTRSWHLLPAGISVVRVDLPAGEHELNVDVGGRSLPLGRVNVAAGRVQIVSARAW